VEITNLGFFRKILPFLNYATWVSNKKNTEIAVFFEKRKKIIRFSDLWF